MLSKIDELIQEFCPEGVEIRVLSDIAHLERGQKPAMEEKSDGEIPVVTAAMNVTEFHSIANFGGNGICISSHGANAGFVSFWENPIWLSNNVFLLLANVSVILPKFLFYILKNNERKIQELPHTGGIPYINAHQILRLESPVPPLELQYEIVKILDTFTQIQIELESELAARREQYHYYRDSLLTFPEQGEVRWASLGEVAQISRGASPRPIQQFMVDDSEGTPWIKIGDVTAESKYLVSTSQFVSEKGAEKSRRISPGDFILTNSMSFGRPYISKIHGCVHDGWLVISDYSEHFNSDFLYHLLGSEFVQKEFRRRVGDGSIQNLNAEIVRSVVLPVPSLELQKEIAELLDQFDLLVSDIQVGLPAELTARRKQYDYYRDKLLTFKELVA